MSKTPNYDAKIQPILNALQPGERTCAITGETWTMTDEEIGWYKKFNVPAPDISPNTRWKWQGYYDVGYQFWWNRHAETGKPVLSFHHPATGVRVLPDAEWFARDFAEISVGYDRTRPFFDQMRELQLKVPLFATFNTVPPENSLALMSLGDRDSYFTFACKSARCFYMAGAFNTEDSSEVFLSIDCTRSHHVVHSDRIYNCRYVRESFDCMDSAFLFDCRNCRNCFGATNKRNAQYLWFNEQLTKEEWERRRAEVDFGRRSVVEACTERFERMLREQAVWPENFNGTNADSTGDYLDGCTRTSFGFSSEKGPVDNYWSSWLYGAPQGTAFCWGAFNCSEEFLCVSSPESSKLKMSYRSQRCEDSEYLYACVDLKNCFGCVGLKKRQFCILNKQYTEDEYWWIVDEIKCGMLERGEYGNYFPTSMASTYVPESGAVLYAGASDEDLRKLGGPVFDPEAEDAMGKDRVDLSKARRIEDVPDSIDDLTDDWIGVPIFDPEANRPFSILKPEAEYYRRERIAPPARHFISRMKALSFSAQKAQLEYRACAVCSAKLLTSANLCYPNRKIYCMKDYLAFVEKNG
ncbi:hypothetical protein HY734_01095 [Candidatus Uhrbacteria bacterium]|nr:hypothetical protein [Candidatus Uhrbacteria bacterium]